MYGMAYVSNPPPTHHLYPTKTANPHLYAKCRLHAGFTAKENQTMNTKKLEFAFLAAAALFAGMQFRLFFKFLSIEEPKSTRSDSGAPNLNSDAAGDAIRESDKITQLRVVAKSNDLSPQKSEGHMHKVITPIRHIFQYGPPRTASTTQFNMACVSLFLHIRAHSPNLLNSTICTVAGSFSNEEEAYKFTLQQDNMPQAVKSHVAEPDPRQVNNSTFIFASCDRKTDAEQTKVMLEAKGLNVGVIQDLETLKKLGIDHWLKVYADFFSLSPNDLQVMSKYFKIWNVLRQCCGMQMSKSYRNDLLPSDKKNSEFRPHPFCGSIDTDVVEASFMNTELYRLISQYQLMRRMNRPSTVDGDLNGTYCSRYSAAVREHGIPEDKKIHDGLNSRYKGIENHWDEELSNPFIGATDLVQSGKCGGHQYIYYLACNGFANQLIGMEVALRIAYSTNRTLIIPPLLPHHKEAPYRQFRGINFFGLSLNPEKFIEGVNSSLDHVATVQSLSSRNDFPSWSEILKLAVLTNQTGVKIVDLYDFIKTNGNACVYEFWRQPSPPVPIVALTNRSKDWVEFIDLFTKQYASHPVALLGSSFVLNHYGSDLFTSHERLFFRHNFDVHNQIAAAVKSLPLSTNMLKLCKAAMSHLPDKYFAVHLRTGDFASERIQSCHDEVVVEQFNAVIEGLNKTNANEDSTIYVASNDGRARDCFNVITQNKYNLVNLTMIVDEDSRSSRPDIRQLTDTISVSDSVKYLLLDLYLVSMGTEIFFAMINFEEGHRYSTFQNLMKNLHAERSQRLKQLNEL